MISSQDWQELCEFLTEVGDPLRIASSPSLREELGQYLGLLLAKNEFLNLTAIRDPKAALWKHLADSLALASLEPLGTIVDWGSGGGLPGIPLALARRCAKQESPVHFLDSVGKKLHAVEEFAKALGLGSSRFFLGRGEDLLKQGALSGVSTIVMRAVAPAERSVRWLHPSVPRWVFMLGPQQLEQWQKEEKRALAKKLRFGTIKQFSLPHGSGERVLLELLRT